MPTKINWGAGPDGEAYGYFNTKMHTSMWRVQMLSHTSHGVVCRTTCNRACVEKLMLSSGCALCHKSSLCPTLPSEPLKAFVMPASCPGSVFVLSKFSLVTICMLCVAASVLGYKNLVTPQEVSTKPPDLLVSK